MIKIMKIRIETGADKYYKIINQIVSSIFNNERLSDSYLESVIEFLTNTPLFFHNSMMCKSIYNIAD